MPDRPVDNSPVHIAMALQVGKALRGIAGFARAIPKEMDDKFIFANSATGCLTAGDLRAAAEAFDAWQASVGLNGQVF